jgi:hypothetical protein
MFNEDNEAVEATGGEAVADVAVDSAPVESTASFDAGTESIEATAEPVEVTETVEASSTEDAEVESVIDWNGEIDALKSANWFEALDAKLQNTLLDGLNNKYKNWQRGYTDKFQEMGVRRKSLDAKEADIRQQEQRVQQWLHGDIDPLQEKQKEIDELKTMHRSAIATLKNEFNEATEKAQNSSQSELQESIQEREALRQQIGQFEAQAKAAEEAEVNQAIDEFDTWVKTSSPEVHSNDDAFKLLCELCAARVEPSEALDMVNFKFKLGEYAPKPEVAPEPEPEVVPQSIDMMNMGTNASGTKTAEARDFTSIMRNLRNQAQAEHEAVLRSTDK